MEITNDEDRSLAKGITIAQGSVFNESANFFAPYYRQMSTSADTSDYDLATQSPEFKKGAQDIMDAFDYYIKEINPNRPFIIEGHSQGTMALIEVINSKFKDNKDLNQRLIAAYLIGYSITDEDLKKSGLRLAKNATDTGVIITYNTQSKESKGGAMVLDGAKCINPLNWKTDKTYASKDKNLGARFYDNLTGELQRTVANYCDAQIDKDKGALIVKIPDGENLDLGGHGEGVYHRYDYDFFSNNLEQNIKDRINSYNNK